MPLFVVPSLNRDAIPAKPWDAIPLE